jgi:hypothetical protein
VKSILRALFRTHALAAAAVAAGLLLASNASADSAASEAAHARKALKADRDCEDIVFPDGTVAECPSVEASQTAVIAHAKHVDATCPPPTHEEGHNRCVLDKDIDLDEPLKLESFTRLDCGGHRLLPHAVGQVRTPGSPGVPATPHVPSTPEVAIVLANAYGVTVENCEIGSLDPLLPFDFGVVVLGSKLPAEVAGDNVAVRWLQNTVASNTIAVRYVGVLIGQSDNTAVTDNQITALIGARGVGIDLLGDSDLNHSQGNSVVAHGTADATAIVPLFPGTAQSPQKPRGIRQNLGSARITNFCMDGELLVQIPGREDAVNEGSSARQEDNVVEGNFVDFGLTSLPFGIATAAGAVRPLITGNTIVGAHQALHFSGLAPGEPFGVAGTCSDDPERACGSDEDCFLTACGDTATKGSCVGAKTRIDISMGATDPLVVGNTVDGSSGKVQIGMYVAIPAPHATIVHNTVRRASLAGIRLNNQSLEATTVTSNAFIENRFGLALVVMPGIEPSTRGDSFGSTISLNDFVGSTRQAIATGVCKALVTTSCETTADCGGTSGPCLTHTMPFPAELSVQGQGNYWGRACSDSDGFRAADEPDALGGRDTSAPNVADSHPYGVSVAGGVDGTTLTCR